jgi:fatty acid amide hydrolase
LSATQLVQQISSGDLSASEAVEAHIAQIERVNPHLNALVVKRYEAARSEARAADARHKTGEALGVLHGLPITVKECLDLTESASTFGLPSRAAQRAVKDERHVARLRQAGAIVLGKTNVAQLLFYYESDNPLYGRTQNPWNLTRTPGGSSGGEAASSPPGVPPWALARTLAAVCGFPRPSVALPASNLPQDARPTWDALVCQWANAPFPARSV